MTIEESAASDRITAAEIEDLLRKLDELSLSAKQRALLGAILKVAADIRDTSEVDERPFSTQFATSFQTTQAQRVLDYAGVADAPHADAIHRTAAAIHRAIHR